MSRLNEWIFGLAAWRAPQGHSGGDDGVSNAVVAESSAHIGAAVMGRNRFGGHPGPWLTTAPWNGLELVRTVAAPKVTHLKFARR